MIDITLENFETELLAISMQVPVLLDIWAPWCGPCKQLGPVLDKLEADYAGRFVLAKLNADEQPEIAGQLSEMFGVRSIPFCVMFAQGQPVDGFVGALPEAQIREFLGKHVAPPQEGGGDENGVDEPGAQAAEDEAQPPSADDALLLLQESVAREPGNDEARFALIKLLLAQGDTAQAQAVFAPMEPRATGPVPESRVLAFGTYVKAAQVAQQARPATELQAAIAANKRDFAARLELAQTHFGQGRFTEAMDELLEIIMRDKAWQDEAARKTYVAVLEVLSKPTPKPGAKAAPSASAAADKPRLELAGKVDITPSDPLIDQYRRKLSMALF